MYIFDTKKKLVFTTINAEDGVVYVKANLAEQIRM